MSRKQIIAGVTANVIFWGFVAGLRDAEAEAIVVVFGFVFVASVLFLGGVVLAGKSE